MMRNNKYHYEERYPRIPTRMAKNEEGDSGNKSFTNKPSKNKKHEFYLVDGITDAGEYVEWCDKIRHAPETDEIHIYINSYGGYLFTAIQLVNSIQKSKAKVIAHVEGACLSAATIIFLSADEQDIHPLSTFMIHDYSGGSFGKGGEMFDQISFERKWSETVFRESYRDFLTKDEIKTVLNGKDFWMNAEEVKKRLESMKAKKK